MRLKMKWRYILLFFLVCLSVCFYQTSEAAERKSASVSRVTNASPRSYTASPQAITAWVTSPRATNASQNYTSSPRPVTTYHSNLPTTTASPQAITSWVTSRATNASPNYVSSPRVTTASPQAITAWVTSPRATNTSSSYTLLPQVTNTSPRSYTASPQAITAWVTSPRATNASPNYVSSPRVTTASPQAITAWVTSPRRTDPPQVMDYRNYLAIAESPLPNNMGRVKRVTNASPNYVSSPRVTTASPQAITASHQANYITLVNRDAASKLHPGITDVYDYPASSRVTPVNSYEALRTPVFTNKTDK